jgi:CDP-glycerol glycerophosphotransferase (TagB/SpsB family)
VSFVYRPHPWGGGGRDGARLARAKFDHVVVDRNMRAYLDAIAAGNKHMSLPDYRDTHDLLSAIDGVISPMSTILLEAALHAKPVVAYTPAGADGSEHLANSLPMLHFADFLKLPEIGHASTADDLIKATSQMADAREGAKRGVEFQRAASHFVAPFERAWRDRLVDFLRDDVLAKRRGDMLPRAAE